MGSGKSTELALAPLGFVKCCQGDLSFCASVSLGSKTGLSHHGWDAEGLKERHRDFQQKHAVICYCRMTKGKLAWQIIC